MGQVIHRTPKQLSETSHGYCVTAEYALDDDVVIFVVVAHEVNTSHYGGVAFLGASATNGISFASVS